MFTKVISWAKANVLIAAAIVAGVVIILMPSLFRSRPSRRRRNVLRIVNRPVRRRNTIRVRGAARRAYNKNGKQKKPWQIKGSEAARRHMRKIRQMR